MKKDDTHSITLLLHKYRTGDADAFNQLVPLVEAQMHRLAEKYLRSERPGHTLQPTALVNEAFLSLLGQREKEWEGREHFLSVAALVMRQVLAGYARKRLTEKRGGAAVRVSFDEQMHSAEKEGIDVLKLDEALDLLARENPRQARIVELRYFGGLSIEEAAKVLGISERTVKREWTVTRAWLHRQLKDGDGA